jgi:hypothetical protein
MAHHAAVELSNTMHGRWLAAESKRDALEGEAANYRLLYKAADSENANLRAERDALRTAAEAMVAWLRAEDDHTGTTFMQRVEMCSRAQDLLEAAVGAWKPAAVAGDKP